jgi:hypothetical protein
VPSVCSKTKWLKGYAMQTQASTLASTLRHPGDDLSG